MVAPLAKSPAAVPLTAQIVSVVDRRSSALLEEDRETLARGEDLMVNMMTLNKTRVAYNGLYLNEKALYVIKLYWHFWTGFGVDLPGLIALRSTKSKSRATMQVRKR